MNLPQNKEWPLHMRGISTMNQVYYAVALQKNKSKLFLLQLFKSDACREAWTWFTLGFAAVFCKRSLQIYWRIGRHLPNNIKKKIDFLQREGHFFHTSTNHACNVHLPPSITACTKLFLHNVMFLRTVTSVVSRKLYCLDCLTNMLLARSSMSQTNGMLSSLSS